MDHKKEDINESPDEEEEVIEENQEKCAECKKDKEDCECPKEDLQESIKKALRKNKKIRLRFK